ncbi:SMI1/KNR4 family protein [Paenibacillus sp. JSM ZJ436]|uniref:SMI1/KNR4 family protein n=1 Tax=Paenibacillus sp. JSM ZJ436 TaxID=3376190 RepID=UPI0037AB6B6F
MRDELLTQLEDWHEEDEFQRIAEAIEEIPAEEQDYELISQLGRAYSNLERYEDAITQFLRIEEEGQEDPLWHYRIGLAYYYAERYDEAEQAFREADRLEPGDEDTLEFLEWIEQEREASAEPDLGEEEAEPAEQAVTAGAPSFRTYQPAAALDLEKDPLSFWNDDAPAAELYRSDTPSEELIASVEEELVFKLPESYVSMMKLHNGGAPRNRFYPVEAAPGQAIEITGILGIGREKKHSLCGSFGSRHIIEQGGYPEVGVVIGQGPSGHDCIMLDYRETGNDGEPAVIHVDRGHGYAVTKLAESFADFIDRWARG